ncbi:MAG TPA: hypothetical protein VK864_14375, partial [Longimicrobiales bacterium]|nr:hypothetical protein [Longimicrobiales bacterium]
MRVADVYAQLRGALGRGRPGATSIWNRFVTWFNALELSENTILLAFSVAVGAAGGLGVVAFYGLIDLAYAALYRLPGVYFSRATLLA